MIVPASSYRVFITGLFTWTFLTISSNHPIEINGLPLPEYGDLHQVEEGDRQAGILVGISTERSRGNPGWEQGDLHQVGLPVGISTKFPVGAPGLGREIKPGGGREIRPGGGHHLQHHLERQRRAIPSSTPPLLSTPLPRLRLSFPVPLPLLEYDLLEESPAGTVVGNILLDYHGSPLPKHVRHHFSRTNSPDVRRHLNIDNTTGILRVTRPIDREQLCPPNHRRAANYGSPVECYLRLDVFLSPVEHFQIIKIRIRILDVNDHAPVFPFPVLNLEISEASARGTLFSLPVAQDPDLGANGVRRYRLVFPASADIVLNGSELFGYRDADVYSTGNSGLDLFGLEVVLASSDQDVVDFKNDLGSSASTSLNSEKRVEADFKGASFEAGRASKAVGTKPGVQRVVQGREDTTVSETGEFPSDQLDNKMRGTGNDIVALFLRLNGDLDRESVTSYRLTLVAEDGEEPARGRRGAITLNITIIDSNDNTPTFEHQYYHLNVTEGAPRGSLIGRVVASDDDEGENGRITYRLSSGEATGSIQDMLPVSVDWLTGDVIVVSDVDYELVDEYVFTVLAVDRGVVSRSGRATVRLRVIDVNDNRPRIRLNQFDEDEVVEEVVDEDDDQDDEELELWRYVKVKENMPSGSFVTHLSVADLDSQGPNSFFSCRLIPMAIPHPLLLPRPLPHTVPHTLPYSQEQIYSVFQLDRLGDVSSDYQLRTSVVLDREVKDEYEVKVECIDEGLPVPLSSILSIRVKVEDENDNPPLFTRSVYAARILENNQIGAYVTRVTITDADLPDVGAESRRQGLDVAPSNIRYYIRRRHVNDSFGDNSNRDADGKRGSGGSDLVWNEGSQNEDAGKDCELKIDELTGEIFAAVYFDREIRDNYDYVITVIDRSGPAHHRSEAWLELKINDLDDEKPTFSRSSYEFEVTENRPADTVVGVVSASDEDLAPFNDVVYEIGDVTWAGVCAGVEDERREGEGKGEGEGDRGVRSNGEGVGAVWKDDTRGVGEKGEGEGSRYVGGLFSIDAGSGLITTGREFDRELCSEYRISIIARNLATHLLQEREQVQEQEQTSSSRTTSWSSFFESSPPAAVTTASTTIAENSASTKTAAAETRRVEASEEIPLATKEKRIVGIGLFEWDSTTVVIRVRDENDNVPIILFPYSPDNDSVNVSCHDARHYVITQIHAVDADEPRTFNSLLSYRLLPPSPFNNTPSMDPPHLPRHPSHPLQQSTPPWMDGSDFFSVDEHDGTVFMRSDLSCTNNIERHDLERTDSEPVVVYNYYTIEVEVTDRGHPPLSITTTLRVIVIGLQAGAGGGAVHVYTQGDGGGNFTVSVLSVLAAAVIMFSAWTLAFRWNWSRAEEWATKCRHVICCEGQEEGCAGGGGMRGLRCEGVKVGVGEGLVFEGGGSPISAVSSAGSQFYHTDDSFQVTALFNGKGNNSDNHNNDNHNNSSSSCRAWTRMLGFLTTQLNVSVVEPSFENNNDNNNNENYNNDNNYSNNNIYTIQGNTDKVHDNGEHVGNRDGNVVDNSVCYISPDTRGTVKTIYVNVQQLWQQQVQHQQQLHQQRRQQQEQRRLQQSGDRFGNIEGFEEGGRLGIIKGANQDQESFNDIGWPYEYSLASSITSSDSCSDISDISEIGDTSIGWISARIGKTFADSEVVIQQLATL